MDHRISTSRPWKDTLVYSYAASHALPSPVLDFGCGRYVDHLSTFRGKGMDVDGFDLCWDEYLIPSARLYSPKSLPPRKYRTVLLSNVLNVQSTEEELSNTLCDARSFLQEAPCLIVANYPRSPRKMRWSSLVMKEFLERDLNASPELKNGVWVFNLS